MRMIDLIERKKRGGALSEKEIRYFIKGFTSGEIPDYQAAALLMAICFTGMTDRNRLDDRRYGLFRRPGGSFFHSWHQGG